MSWVFPAIMAGGSILGSLATKGGSKKQEERTGITYAQRWSPQQRLLFRAISDQINRAAGGQSEYPTTAAPPAPRSPAGSVPTQPGEQSYQDMIRQIAEGRAGQGVPLYDIGPEFAEQYFEESIKPLYMKEWKDVTLPSIERAYAGPNFYSSARQEATRKGGQDLALELASKKANLVYGEELNRRQAIDQAFDRQMGVAREEKAVGEQQRAIEEGKVMENLNRWFMGEEVDGEYNPLNNPAMQYAFSLLGIDPYIWSTQTYGKSEQRGDPFGQFAGGAGQAIMNYFMNKG